MNSLVYIENIIRYPKKDVETFVAQISVTSILRHWPIVLIKSPAMIKCESNVLIISHIYLTPIIIIKRPHCWSEK